jgi:hypothetical protein
MGLSELCKGRERERGRGPTWFDLVRLLPSAFPRSVASLSPLFDHPIPLLVSSPSLLCYHDCMTTLPFVTQYSVLVPLRLNSCHINTTTNPCRSVHKTTNASPSPCSPRRLLLYQSILLSRYTHPRITHIIRSSSILKFPNNFHWSLVSRHHPPKHQTQ